MVLLAQGQSALGKTASLLGISQGVVWFIMSLLCIIEYSIEVPPNQPDTMMGRFNTHVYYLYLDKGGIFTDKTVVTPLAFIVFVSLYIVLTTMWFVASCFQINVLKKSSVNVPVVFKDWALITWFVSLLDLILVVLLGVDYNRLCEGTIDEDKCASTRIPIIVIAARGFILWFVNVIVAWRLYASAKVMRKANPEAYKGTFRGILPISRPIGYIPRAQVSSNPSLYSQQLDAVSSNKSYWNVNLGTAMVARTPPITPGTPRTPYGNGNGHTRFFPKY